jgi:hypothetical protein
MRFAPLDSKFAAGNRSVSARTPFWRGTGEGLSKSRKWVACIIATNELRPKPHVLVLDSNPEGAPGPKAGYHLFQNS